MLIYVTDNSGTSRDNSPTTVVGALEAVREALKCGAAHITTPEWGGGCVILFGPGACCPKWFPGHDAHGFGGAVPPEAYLVVDLLSPEGTDL